MCMPWGKILNKKKKIGVKQHLLFRVPRYKDINTQSTMIVYFPSTRCRNTNKSFSPGRRKALISHVKQLRAEMVFISYWEREVGVRLEP